MARSFAGDKKQLVPLLKAALKHKGTAFLDIISPCVTFNDFDGSTKSWDWAKEHEEPLQEVGFVPRLPEIEVEQKAGQSTRVQLHDGSWITLRALLTRSTTSPAAAPPSSLLEQSQRQGRVPHRPALRRHQASRLPGHLNMVDTPLALLDEETLRPKPEVLAKIMETI